MDDASGMEPDTYAYDELVFRQMLDEVYLLLDFISGRSDRSLAALAGIRIPTEPTVAGAEEAPSTLDEVIAHISTLRFPPKQYAALTPRNAAFLILVKDRLNRIAGPANGMTITYTAMVVGSQPAPEAFETRHAGRTGPRMSLAFGAYPGLINSAKKLRWIIWAGIWLLLLLTCVTAYTSGVVAFGRSTLQHIEEVKQELNDLAGVIGNIETTQGTRESPSAVGASGSRTPFYRLCDRPKLLAAAPPGDLMPVDVFDNPVERQLCDRWRDIDHRQTLAYQNLDRFERGVLYVYELPEVAVRGLRRTFGSESAKGEERFDVGEQWVGAILASLSNYVLPMCFTLLGTGVSIVRDIYGKVHEHTLSPRDLPLSFGRFALGMVAGAAIGLFYSPSQVAAAASSGLSGSIVLSAQGLAFLAGYGVDSVFRVFDAMLRRLERAAQPAPLNGTASPAIAGGSKAGNAPVADRS